MSEYFEWRRFLDLAEHLASDSIITDQEAARRTSVSRAYYAAYHAARILGEARSLIEEGTAHQKVWIAFDPRKRGALRQFQQLYDWGRRLQNNRVKADYETENLDWNEQCKTSLELARRLIALVDGISR